MIDCNCASFYFLRERMEKVFKRKTKEGRLVLAICYDFDKTLSPDDMQAQGYIQSVGYEVESFWKESNGLAESNDMDQNLHVHHDSKGAWKIHIQSKDIDGLWCQSEFVSWSRHLV